MVDREASEKTAIRGRDAKLDRVSRRVVAAAFGVVLLAACARIAGLADSDKLPSSPPHSDGPGKLENDAGAVISWQTLQFEAGCGTPNDSDFITIKNDSDGDLNYQVTSPAPEILKPKDDAKQGTIKAHSPQVVFMHVAADNAGSHPVGLVVATGNDVQTLHATATVDGAQLVLPDGGLDWGQVQYETAPEDKPFTIQNSGTQPASITGWTPPGDFSVTGPASIDPGQSASFSGHFAQGAESQPLDIPLQPQVGAPMCGSPSLDMRGQRVNQDVTINTTKAAFGCVPCGAAPPVQTLTLSNFATQVATVSGGSSTSFNVQLPPTVPPRTAAPGQATINISPKQIGTTPTQVIAEQISFTVTGAKPTSFTVSASYAVCGGILSFSATTANFNSSSPCHTITIRNIGNAPVAFGIQTTGAFRAYNYPGSLGPGEESNNDGFCVTSSLFPTSSDVVFTTSAPGTYPGTLTAQPQGGSVLCGPAPTTTLNGQN
jgi:hypothetical protein